MAKSLYLALGLAGALATNGCYTEEKTVFQPTSTRIGSSHCFTIIEKRVQIEYLAGFEIQRRAVSSKEIGKIYHPNDSSRPCYEYCTPLDETDPSMGMMW